MPDQNQAFNPRVDRTGLQRFFAVSPAVLGDRAMRDPLVGSIIGFDLSTQLHGLIIGALLKCDYLWRNLRPKIRDIAAPKESDTRERQTHDRHI